MRFDYDIASFTRAPARNELTITFVMTFRLYVSCITSVLLYVLIVDTTTNDGRFHCIPRNNLNNFGYGRRMNENKIRGYSQ